MSYLDASAGQAGTPDAQRLRDEDAAAWGYVPNFTGTFSLRPAVYRAWRQLNGSIRDGMDARRYELVTTAAAAALHSSYCTLAHGRILARDHMPAAEVAALVAEPDTADLPSVDRAIVAFAARVAGGADRIDETDIEKLRAHGLADDEIFDVVLAAAARCFFSTCLEATGTPPDAAFAALPAQLREALTVGRPIEGA
ncbi:MAG TPA: carboxymuconolactone decarboxylase family protein [Actinoplanes sp.]|jgi:uncharacterized peroxidase-related enzyme